jgi:hypothetical protein
MAMRPNMLTRFIEEIVDDTKDFVDDVLDQAKDLETDVRGAVTDVIDDEKVSASDRDVAGLQAALADLTTKVNQLAELQLAGAKA